MSSPAGLIEVRTEGRVATVKLNRPELRNALSIPMLHDLTAAFGDLAARRDLRATVLEGAGPDFCAGADFSELELISARGAGDAGDPLDFDAPFTDALSAIAEHPVPVVAKVHGRALGGGCQLVLAADLVVAEEGARLGIPSARLGIVIPLDSIERLVLAVGPRRAREMLFASRTLTAAEAQAWGLVNRTSAAGALDQATEEMVADVVGSAPLSVRASKRGISAAVAGLAAARSSGSPDRADFDELAAQALVSRDLAEGIAAFRERRRPEFGGNVTDRASPIEERAPEIIRRLTASYPGATVALRFTNPLECLVATILSAQCTDERVNMVTQGPGGLFAKYRTPLAYLDVPEAELAADIKPTGFFNNKARSIRGACRVIVERFDGEVPRSMAELITLPGVARKTANIVQGNSYPEQHSTDPDAGMAVDTHVGRLAQRLGFTEERDPDKIERALMRYVPRSDRFGFTYVLIDHGRAVCVARVPKCEVCPVNDICPSSRV